MSLIPETGLPEGQGCNRSLGSTRRRRHSPSGDWHVSDSYVDRFGSIDEWKALYEADDWTPRELTPAELQRQHFNHMFVDVHKIRHRFPVKGDMVVFADSVLSSLRWLVSLWTRLHRRVKTIHSAKRRLLELCKSRQALRNRLLDALLQVRRRG